MLVTVDGVTFSDESGYVGILRVDIYVVVQGPVLVRVVSVRSEVISLHLFHFIFIST